jgi:hypothetical protein
LLGRVFPNISVISVRRRVHPERTGVSNRRQTAMPILFISLSQLV